MKTADGFSKETLDLKKACASPTKESTRFFLTVRFPPDTDYCYTSNGNTHASPHLFLFTQEENGIKLTSYEVPNGYDKNTFTYKDLKEIDYNELRVSEKFTPALYIEKDGVWEGGSTSMFSPVLKFTLFERFSEEYLEVSETMEVRGKRTFGYDEPIIYKRVI